MGDPEVVFWCIFIKFSSRAELAVNNGTKRWCVFCVVEMIFVKNTKSATFAGSAAHLYKAIFRCIRTGNRPFHESLINNKTEWAFFQSFLFLCLWRKKLTFTNYSKHTHQFLNFLGLLKKCVQNNVRGGYFLPQIMQGAFSASLLF